MLKHLCGTPKEHCLGSSIMVNAFLGKAAGQMVHGTPPEAFKCYARYLVQVLGYQQIGGREFRMDGQPVLVLTKQSRFGAPMRPGKSGDKATKKASRVMPNHKGSGVFV